MPKLRSRPVPKKYSQSPQNHRVSGRDSTSPFMVLEGTSGNRPRHHRQPYELLVGRYVICKCTKSSPRAFCAPNSTGRITTGERNATQSAIGVNFLAPVGCIRLGIQRQLSPYVDRKPQYGCYMKLGRPLFNRSDLHARHWVGGPRAPHIDAPLP